MAHRAAQLAERAAVAVYGGRARKPHSVPGIVDSGIDINSYEGDAVKLAAEWSGPVTVEPPTA